MVSSFGLIQKVSSPAAFVFHLGLSAAGKDGQRFGLPAVAALGMEKIFRISLNEV
jgi:hypothetical protein